MDTSIKEVKVSRLEHSFARKYLEDLLTSIDISEAIVSNLIQEIEKVDLN
jgi:hypothetical protein